MSQGPGHRAGTLKFIICSFFSIQNMLYIHAGCVILYHAKRRRSILVNYARFLGRA